MQLEIRFDTKNVVVFKLQLQAALPGGEHDGPEVVAAVVADNKLTDITLDQALDVVGQLVDHMDQGRSPPLPAEDDWREKFRSGGKF